MFCDVYNFNWIVNLIVWFEISSIRIVEWIKKISLVINIKGVGFKCIPVSFCMVRMQDQQNLYVLIYYKPTEWE